MRLAFLMEKVYWPYAKWFSSGFDRLKCSSFLTPKLKEVLTQTNWKDREAKLTEIYEYMARLHNSLGLTETLPETTSNFHARPYLVIHSELFADAIRKKITNKEILQLPPIGSVDQFAYCTDVHSQPSVLQKLRSVYDTKKI
jgi:hypothetical protein